MAVWEGALRLSIIPAGGIRQSSQTSNMKRKLDTDNVPNEASAPSQASDPSANTFADFGLDSRILQGVVKEKFAKPTSVQAKAIPLALDGKDILARAKTGSGKTAAYLLPILHSILKRKAVKTTPRCISALILVPTRELAEQVSQVVGSLTSFCAKDLRAVNLTHKVSDAVQRALLASSPDIVIATPARVSTNLDSSALTLDNLAHLVIDEADLVLSYDYEEDLRTLSKSVPQGVQSFLISATLSGDVDTLKGLFCRNPVVLTLDEPEADGGRVSQFVVRCGEDEKFLLIYVIFKLKLVKGKCIVFVGDIDRCYRLKLYLEQFGTRSCILNSELPVNSRIHVVEEFNKNVYDIIIATDDHEVVGESEGDNNDSALHEERGARGASEAKDHVGNLDGLSTSDQPAKEDANKQASKVNSKSSESLAKKRKRTTKDKEYGVSRGIDFKNVACILNFDLPSTSNSYTHRIGRTARAGKTGMALSFVVPKELYRKHIPTTFTSAQHDEAVLARIVKHQAKKGNEVKPYHFNMKQVDAFRYRMGDALRAVTRTAIREARTRELRQELIKSERLKRHFEENPGDLYHLRHDGELRAAKVQSHLKHVPQYLLPLSGAKAIAGSDVGFVGIGKTSENRIRKARAHNRARARGKKAPGKKADPLKTFRAKRAR